MKEVSIKWIAKNANKINIIDVRTKAEYENGNIKGSKNITVKEILCSPDLWLNKKDDFFIMCYSGSRSLHVIKSLEDKGYKNLINVKEGFSSL